MPLKRKSILDRFPWMLESGHKMICGCDLDALLSAQFLYHRLGWEIAGFYDFTNLYLSASISPDEILKPVYVDLDINRRDVKSIGHHIVESPDFENHTHINPNFLRDVNLESFEEKYPLGTIHFLLWLFNHAIKNHPQVDLLLWLPDSSWINAQTHKFRENVRDWLNNWLPFEPMKETFPETDTRKFEKRMIEFCRHLSRKTGFSITDAQSYSRHLRFPGIQCQITDFGTEFMDRIKRLFRIVRGITGWKIPELPAPVLEIKGGRLKANGNFHSVLEKLRPFSYAFTNKSRMNYTVFEKFKGDEYRKRNFD